ncbi:hypothetical protein BIV57_13575 [Mangrovactinospora gilvigrisea]|uniref:Conjugal transfer protein n=1 Tax=Mangrovactinospora gilvigrisea TaxID=1428644 RepID=A0A1J7BEL0_9ACTN|nr:conjugal transfer protein [Mangrovactinospora gilvigrisea]OIV37013.1 hypothetical protein BIV57_13575 [Mangrovactinospora gilvigrisea]
MRPSIGLGGKLARLAAFSVLACGPLALAAVILTPSAAPSAPAPSRVVPASTSAAAAGPSGFADLFVSTYLSAGQGTEDSLTPFLGQQVTLSTDPGSRRAQSTVVTALTQVAAGYWSVTVAADVVTKSGSDQGVHYFRVGVQASSASGAGTAAAPAGFVATTLPAEVGPPQTLKPSNLIYQRQIPDLSDPVAATAGQFLTAYLVAGETGPERYTSPGTRISKIDPAPYRRLEVTGVADDGDPSLSSTAVPADGTRRHALAQVQAKDAAGNQVSLTYAMTLTARAGRWEVTDLDPAPTTSSPTTR